MGKEIESVPHNHPVVRMIIDTFEKYNLSDLERLQVLNDLVDTITHYPFGSKDKDELPSLEDLVGSVLNNPHSFFEEDDN